jgi:hypothetical protein
MIRVKYGTIGESKHLDVGTKNYERRQGERQSLGQNR